MCNDFFKKRSNISKEIMNIVLSAFGVGALSPSPNTRQMLGLF